MDKTSFPQPNSSSFNVKIHSHSFIVRVFLWSSISDFVKKICLPSNNFQSLLTSWTGFARLRIFLFRSPLCSGNWSSVFGLDHYRVTATFFDDYFCEGEKKKESVRFLRYDYSTRGVYTVGEARLPNYPRGLRWRVTDDCVDNFQFSEDFFGREKKENDENFGFRSLTCNFVCEIGIIQVLISKYFNFLILYMFL